MQRFEYYSALSPESVRARLAVMAKPLKSSGDQYDEHQLFAKLLPEGRFYLLKTGGAWQLRPQFPFAGSVVPWGSGSLISGNFAMPRSGWVQFAVLGGIAFAAALAFGVPLPAALMILALFLGLACGFILPVGGDASNPQNREVLAFIEENLLKE